MGRVQGGKLCFWLVGGKAYPSSSWMLTPSCPQHTQEEFIKAATPSGEPQSGTPELALLSLSSNTNVSDAVRELSGENRHHLRV